VRVVHPARQYDGGLPDAAPFLDEPGEIDALQWHDYTLFEPFCLSRTHDAKSFPKWPLHNTLLTRLTPTWLVFTAAIRYN